MSTITKLESQISEAERRTEVSDNSVSDAASGEAYALRKRATQLPARSTGDLAAKLRLFESEWRELAICIMGADAEAMFTALAAIKSDAERLAAVNGR